MLKKNTHKGVVNTIWNTICETLFVSLNSMKTSVNSTTHINVNVGLNALKGMSILDVETHA